MATPQPTPGPQQPEKYKPYNVGPKYARFGEQAGWIYIPWKDTYELDPKNAQAYGESSGLIEPTPEPTKPPGLADTLLPVAATVGTIAGANALIPQIIGSSTTGTGLLGSLGGAGSSAAPVVDAAASIPAATAPTGLTGAANALVGGSLAPGAIPGSASATAPYGVLAGAGGEGVATAAGTTAAPAASGGLLGIGALPLAAIAAGTILGGKSAYDMFRGKKDNSLGGLIGRGTLGIATGGLSEIARPFLARKSTRDIAREDTQRYLEQAPDDLVWQDYVKGMRAQYDSAPTDPSKPYFGGKYGSWDEYKQAGLDAADLTGVPGNLDAFGSEWAHLTFDQRKQITQGLIDADLYESTKGAVRVKDLDAARKIKDAVLSAPTPTTAANSGATGGLVGAGSQAARNDQRFLPRSSTRSPGIGKDGKPIVVYKGKR